MNASELKNTLSMGKNNLPMKANLVANESSYLAKHKSYKEKEEHGFVLHDGPPYANGNLHVGHMVNKFLKDFIVRAESQKGNNPSFVLGWDCHGLPIELKALAKSKTKEVNEIRELSKQEASKWIDVQRQEMKRLMLLTDYSKNYETMSPLYESNVLEVFLTLVKKGLVYQDYRPIRWSVENHTSLAEAELEYYDVESDSLYFFVKSTVGFYFLVWTTTPWSLPGNQALAFNKDIEYVFVNLNNKKTMVSKFYADKNKLEVVDHVNPLSLLETNYHSLFDGNLKLPVLNADFVDEKSGTGFVHIAPAHGKEDYELCKKNKINVNCPISQDCKYTYPDFLSGVHVSKSKEEILKRIDVYSLSSFSHSYPCDWRSKKPTITISTPQIFISLDKHYENGKNLKENSVDALENVNFYPSNSKNRLVGTIKNRFDWCVSRQRHWGLPLPVFYKDGQAILDEELIHSVIKLFREHGSDCWYKFDTKHFTTGTKWENENITKGMDTFDVWFESGCSWKTLKTHQSDVYLEGSDQHRGWFQSSLLLSVACNGIAPYKKLVTHGFCLDSKGKPMSKSEGNTVDVKAALSKYGTDVLRLWTFSLDYHNDIRCGDEYFSKFSNYYSKIRNTFKFMLGHLDDFVPSMEVYEKISTNESLVEKSFLGYFFNVKKEYYKFLSNFEFKEAFSLLWNFINEDVSSLYLSFSKDRLYCDGHNSERRLNAQHCLYLLSKELCEMLSPVLPYTCDEISVLLNKNVDLEYEKLNFSYDEKSYTYLKQLQKSFNKLNTYDGNKLDLSYSYPCKSAFSDCDLADLLNISQFSSESQVESIAVIESTKCDRSWKRTKDVKFRNDLELNLSDRDYNCVIEYLNL